MWSCCSGILPAHHALANPYTSLHQPIHPARSAWCMGTVAPRAFHTIWVQASAPSGGWPPPALYWLLPPVHSGMAAAHVFHPVPAA